MSSTISGLSSMYTSDYWKSVTNTQDLEKNLSSDMTSKTDDELMSVCKEFEQYFVEQMLKTMQKLVPESDVSENAYVNMFGDMLTQEYAGLAVDHEELGIAQKLYEQMKRTYGL